MNPKLYKKFTEPLRVVNVALSDFHELSKIWVYKIEFIETKKGVEPSEKDLQTEYVLGKDVTDALYRFQSIKTNKNIGKHTKKLLLG